jgi:hypothetical protein
MASNSISLPFPRTRERQKVATARYAPTVRTVIIVCVALLILFGWLYLILALEIAATGRQIQVMTAELERLERQKEMKQFQISTVMSSRNMEERALEAGYAPQEPVYLTVHSPASQP